MERFAKNSNFYSIDFFHFFAKRRKSAEKTTHRKKNRGHRTSKIVKSTQSYSNGHLPYYCSLYYLARALEVNFVRNKDAQKQLARTSLRARSCDAMPCARESGKSKLQPFCRLFINIFVIFHWL